MAVLGTSSAHHSWDPLTETFVPTHGVMLIDGKNQVVSARCSELRPYDDHILTMIQFHETISNHRNSPSKNRDARDFPTFTISKIKPHPARFCTCIILRDHLPPRCTLSITTFKPRCRDTHASINFVALCSL